jgi:hypothetical protein
VRDRPPLSKVLQHLLLRDVGDPARLLPVALANRLRAVGDEGDDVDDGVILDAEGEDVLCGV